MELSLPISLPFVFFASAFACSRAAVTSRPVRCTRMGSAFFSLAANEPGCRGLHSSTLQLNVSHCPA